MQFEMKKKLMLTPLVPLVPLVPTPLVPLSICFFLAACSSGTSADAGDEARKKLKEQLCSIAPSECNSKFTQQVYLAPPDAIYERMVRDQKLRIPFGYVSSTEMMSDPRYKKEESNVYLEAQMPELTPHSSQNLREFFRPYYLSSVGIEIWIPGAEAISWEKRVEGVIQGARRSYRNPTQLPEKYGLKGWGENYKVWPRLAPCRQVLNGPELCMTLVSPDLVSNENVLIPIIPNGPLSVITCDPDELGDIDQEIMNLPLAERELLFSSNAGAGQRRSMCRHEMFYEKLNVSLWLTYPRRFLPQWRETEDRMRALLDSFIPATTSPKK